MTADENLGCRGLGISDVASEHRVMIMENYFNVNVASRYDVNTAIFLHNIKFWTLINLANNDHMHDGQCWTYNTLEAYADIFPYWTVRQIRTIIDNCIDYGLLSKSNYNQTEYDRTAWYALTYDGMKLYPELVQEKYLKRLISTQRDSNPASVLICQKWQMDLTELTNRSDGIDTPIPDINTDKIKTHTRKPSASVSVVKKLDSGIKVSDMLKDNPHKISEEHLTEWKKERIKPLTARVWTKTNQVLTQLVEKGLPAPRAFEIMLQKAWADIEVHYFDKYLSNKLTRPQPKFKDALETSEIDADPWKGIKRYAEVQDKK